MLARIAVVLLIGGFLSSSSVYECTWLTHLRLRLQYVSYERPALSKAYLKAEGMSQSCIYFA